MLSEKNSEQNVDYFREKLQGEKIKLQTLCEYWKDIQAQTPDLSEDVQGHIQASVGKTQLLIDQRFKQFNQLIDFCEFKTSAQKVTYADLCGFWDMILFQVDDVKKSFEFLSHLQRNNWIESKENIGAACQRTGLKNKKLKTKK